jgi:coproporphyrinogen III oxidase
MKNIDKTVSHYSELHEKVCNLFEETICMTPLAVNCWETETGRGVTSVIQHGNIIEKGGINFSFVHGHVSTNMKKILGEEALYYHVTGISSVMHPVNPYVPIIHMNVRYFSLDNGTEWFGGGIDLTPHYIDQQEAISFHRSLKKICDRYDVQFYPRLKKWADDYFYLPHRKELRGVGGIFFDRIKPGKDLSFDKLLNFTIDLGDAYPRMYKEIVMEKTEIAFSDRESKWQNLRRGRYIEFNLIHDRGTKFGLESGRNIEATFISLPASASWEYNFEPIPGSPESNTMSLLKQKEIDWVNFKV